MSHQRLLVDFGFSTLKIKAPTYRLHVPHMSSHKSSVRRLHFSQNTFPPSSLNSIYIDLTHNAPPGGFLCCCKIQIKSSTPFFSFFFFFPSIYHAVPLQSIFQRAPALEISFKTLALTSWATAVLMLSEFRGRVMDTWWKWLCTK